VECEDHEGDVEMAFRQLRRAIYSKIADLTTTNTVSERHGDCFPIQRYTGEQERWLYSVDRATLHASKIYRFALTASSRSLSTFNAILRFAGTTHERMQFESFTVGLEPARTQGAPATTLSDIDSPAVWLRSASRLARKPNALDEIYTPAASSRLEKSLRYLSQ
jgi:hypothetical protein